MADGRYHEQKKKKHKDKFQGFITWSDTLIPLIC